MDIASEVRLRDARQEDLPAILDIYNESVLGSAASFDLVARTMEEQERWFADHHDPLHPVIVAEYSGSVVAWGSLSTYKLRPAYRCTVEISTYVHRDARGLGLGKQLVNALCARGAEAGAHSIVAYIVGSNAASIRMCETCGFIKVGELREVGYKFDAWHDVVIMQRMCEVG